MFAALGCGTTNPILRFYSTVEAPAHAAHLNPPRTFFDGTLRCEAKSLARSRNEPWSKDERRQSKGFRILA
jgi:hypothetical protein